jgi:hypothetical protein
MRKLTIVLALAVAACAHQPSSPRGQAPTFRVDPTWPKQGNLHTSEVGFGRRAQKFTLVSF